MKKTIESRILEISALLDVSPEDASDIFFLVNPTLKMQEEITKGLNTQENSISLIGYEHKH